MQDKQTRPTHPHVSGDSDGGKGIERKTRVGEKAKKRKRKRKKGGRSRQKKAKEVSSKI